MQLSGIVELLKAGGGEAGDGSTGTSAELPVATTKGTAGKLQIRTKVHLQLCALEALWGAQGWSSRESCSSGLKCICRASEQQGCCKWAGRCIGNAEVAGPGLKWQAGGCSEMN